MKKEELYGIGLLLGILGIVTALLFLLVLVKDESQTTTEEYSEAQYEDSEEQDTDLYSDSDYESSNYSSSDYGSSDYDSSDYSTSDYGSDYESSNYSSSDYGSSDYDSSDYSTSDYGSEEYDSNTGNGYNPDDPFYSANDYNCDGKINDQEWQDAMSDAITYYYYEMMQNQ